METKKEEKDLKIEENIELEKVDHKGDKIKDKIDNIKGPKISAPIELFRNANKRIKFYSIFFGPNVFVSINGIDIIDRLSGVDIKGPNINVPAPAIDIKGPSIDAPSLNNNGPKIEDNNIIQGKGLPGEDIKVSKIDDRIGLPEVGIKQLINYIIIHGPNIFISGSGIDQNKLIKINKEKRKSFLVYEIIKNIWKKITKQIMRKEEKNRGILLNKILKNKENKTLNHYNNIWKKITKQIREEDLKKNRRILFSKILRNKEKKILNHYNNIWKKITKQIMIEEDLKRKEEEYNRKKEEEERIKKKKVILERQLNFRKIQQNQEKKENIKEVLEDMCVLGSIMKEEIIEEKKNNPEKFISIEEATKEENKNNGSFCLGILAQNLENMGITTAIEKNGSNDEESQNAANTVLQFITNGMIEKKKYDFHFDLGDERNNELLNNKVEQEKFNNKLRKKLSIEYDIPEEKIIITNPQKGSYSVQVIFEKEDFNKDVDINTLKDNCTDKEFEELKNLKEVHKGLIMDGCKLTPSMLDSKGNRESGWGENEKRGGFDYFPPKGWKGYGLKVVGKYDGGNDDWLAYNGNENEWAIAYHGIGDKVGTVEQATKNIFTGGFKAGGGQAYKKYKNDNPKYKPDNNGNNHKETIGIGVYCSPNPKVMEEYAGYAKKKANLSGKNYLMGFMMRVKPDKIRYSNSQKDYWILDGSTNEMRPYRIMLKEC